MELQSKLSCPAEKKQILLRRFLGKMVRNQVKTWKVSRHSNLVIQKILNALYRGERDRHHGAQEWHTSLWYNYSSTLAATISSTVYGELTLLDVS